MGKDATPIALVSQVFNGPHLRKFATQLANWINEALLQYPECGYLYFEDGVSVGQRFLCQQIFEYFGYTHRLRLFRPEVRPKDWAYLEFAVGEEIDR